MYICICLNIYVVGCINFFWGIDELGSFFFLEIFEKIVYVNFIL